MTGWVLQGSVAMRGRWVLDMTGWVLQDQVCSAGVRREGSLGAGYDQLGTAGVRWEGSLGAGYDRVGTAGPGGYCGGQWVLGATGYCRGSIGVTGRGRPLAGLDSWVSARGRDLAAPGAADVCRSRRVC